MDPITRKFSRLFELGEEEATALRMLHDDYLDIEPDQEIITAGEPVKYSYLMQIGWSMLYKLMPDGSQQILNFAIPGDFLGVHGMVLDRAVHSVRTVTRTRICRVPADELLDLFRGYPRLALAICWMSARDTVFSQEHLARIGRQSAYDRTAHIFLELRERLDAVGLVKDDSFKFPVTQEMLADTLGLTAVHINRTLKKLRNDGLIELLDHRLQIHDRDRLARITGYDSGYLTNSSVSSNLVNQPDLTRPNDHSGS